MRYINQLYLLVFLIVQACLVTSCMEEEINNGGEKVFPDGEAYISMTVDPGEIVAETRSGDKIGSVNDLKVHSVRVVLYDGETVANENDREVEYVFEFEINSDSWTSGGTTGWVAGTTGVTGGVDADGVITPDGQQLYQQLNNKYQFVTFAQRVKAKDYKMLVILNGKAFSGTSPIYDKTKVGRTYGGLMLAMDMTVDPATGKLNYDNKGIVMTNHQGLVDVPESSLGTTADNANSNPIVVAVDRMLAKVTVDHAQGFVLSNNLSNPTWTLDMTNKKTYAMRKMTVGETIQTGTFTMQNLYAEDPNYSTLSSASDIDLNFKSIYADGHIPSGSVTNNLGDWEYTLENTKDPADKSQVTNIVVGYTYTPDGLTAGTSYYVYKNKVILQDSLNKYKSTPSAIPSYFAGLDMVLNNIPTTFDTSGGASQYYEYEGFRFCHQGELYYSIPIRHFEVAQGTLGYYGVVRNNMYSVKIKEINPPGVGGPSLSADIHIQPWGKRNQTSTIGIVVDETGDQNPTVKFYYISLSDTDPASPGDPLNLYPPYFEATYPGVTPVPECWEIRKSVGETIVGSGYNLDMSGQGHYYYISVPSQITVHANSANNVITQYYRRTSGGIPMPKSAHVYFIEESVDPTILTVPTLKIRKKADGEFTTLAYVPVNSLGPEYEIYVKVLGQLYSFEDGNGDEYEIIAKDYVKKTTLSAPPVLVFGTFEDPIVTHYGAGPYAYDIYVLCKKK